MKTSQYVRQAKYKKGFIAPLLLALVAIFFIGGGAYVYMQKNQANQSVVVTPITQETPTTQTGGTYSIPQCGMGLIVKTNETVKTYKKKMPTDGGPDFSISVGSNGSTSRPGSAFGISCRAKEKNEPEMQWSNEVSNLISVQSDGSNEVDKSDYRVLDEQTLSSISKLYLAKNVGYTSGSVIGFETQDWMYTIGFYDPELVKNQDSYIISVVNTTQN